MLGYYPSIINKDYEIHELSQFMQVPWHSSMTHNSKSAFLNLSSPTFQLGSSQGEGLQSQRFPELALRLIHCSGMNLEDQLV